MMQTDAVFRLDGKVALVTGSTRGIGLTTARRMGVVGARIVVTSRRPEACAAVAAELMSEGIEAVGITCRLGEPEEREKLAKAAMAAFGRLDILVANAAAHPVFSTLQDLPEEAWDKIFETNLKGTWHLSRLLLPEIAKQGGGAMIILSSTGSLTATPRSGGYSISKAALNHLARQLAQEWGPQGIRVNAIAPGVTLTEMVRAAYPDDAARQTVVDRTPLRRIGTSEDVANLALFLASDGALHLTGQTLVVDGGASLTAAVR